MRNALIMDYIHTNNSSVILELISNYGDNSEVMLLINEAMNVLIRENYETKMFALIEQFLSQQPKEGEALIKDFNTTYKKIESNQANSLVISEYNELSQQLAPITRLRKLASVSMVNGMFLTEYFNEDIENYCESSFRLLRMLMADPLINVRNDAIMYVYYLANKKHTNEYSPLKENLTKIIIHEMYSDFKNTPIFLLLTSHLSIDIAEIAIRLSILLIMDDIMDSGSNREQANFYLNEIDIVLKHFIKNITKIIPIEMLIPHLMPVLRRQITFQSDYVNNILEYQAFWDEELIPIKSSDDNVWCRDKYRNMLPFIFHYNTDFRTTLRDNKMG